MSYKIKNTITEDQHGLIGVGDIIYKYDTGLKEITISVGTINTLNFTGEKAIEIAKKITFEEFDNTIVRIKQLASDACGVPYIRLYEKTKTFELSFARWLVFWYVRRYNTYYSLGSIGKLFNRDHATTLHGIRQVEKESKYLKEDQVRFRDSFLVKLRAEKFITPEDYKKITARF